MTRFYSVKGMGSHKQLPSVTSIIQETLPEPPELEAWRRKNTNWKTILARAQVHGTLIHHRILAPLHMGLLELPDIPMTEWYTDTLEIVENGEYMWNTLDIKVGFPRLVEHLIIHRKEKYAGRLDMCAPISFDGDEFINTIVDLKTSKQVRDVHKIQMGGYYGALPDKQKPEQGLIVGLPPESKSLTPHTTFLYKEDLLKYEEQFYELAREWHKRHSL